MKKKVRGFTAVEMVVVLSLIVIISGIVYTFFSNNNKTLQKTQLRSALQTQAERIQNKLLYVGTNGCIISSMKDASSDDGMIMHTIVNSEQSINEISIVIPKENVEEVDLSDSSTFYTYRFKLEGSKNSLNARKLVCYDPTVSKTDPIVLSENVEEVIIKPVDIEGSSCQLNQCNGVKVSVKLHQKKGLNDIEYPIETIMKFRNYNKVK